MTRNLGVTTHEPHRLARADARKPSVYWDRGPLARSVYALAACFAAAPKLQGLYLYPTRRNSASKQ